MILLGFTAAFALEDRIELGSRDHWSDMRVLQNVIIRSGFRGAYDLLLEDYREPTQPETDLLISFDSLPLHDAAGRYRADDSGIEISTTVRRVGDAAGVFRGDGRALALEPRAGAAFFPGTFWDSLEIEFWLYPATLEEGETLLRWDGARQGHDGVTPQQLRVYVRNRRLVWEFVNLFIPPHGAPTTITVTAHGGVVPRRWSHHQLRYDARFGVLEYLVDREPQGIEYATSSGAERGDVFTAFVGESAAGPLRIGSSYRGFIDELRITHAARLPEPRAPYRPLPQDSGLAVSAPLPLGNRGGRIVAIDAVWSAPYDSDVRFFYRVGDKRATIEGLAGAWAPFEPGIPLQPISEGRYVQVRIELLPDPRGRESPRVSQLSIDYEPYPPPPRPVGLTATAADGAVELNWNAIHGSDVAGYLVYYGESPGAYFGDEAVAGRSPIDVGDRTRIRLEGLSNGRAYYFAVAAYGRTGVADAGRLSAEAFARPSRAAR
ncbi:MAG: hypothetical protein EA384_13965 [Spirochaetaceae bacterium]|nr:MAG: hypothetical protein EA384_13965 [Spirochaetaceae bacterium]